MKITKTIYADGSGDVRVEEYDVRGQRLSISMKWTAAEARDFKYGSVEYETERACRAEMAKALERGGM